MTTMADSQIDLFSSYPEWTAFLAHEHGFQEEAHHREIATRLDLVCRGEIERLMILMPPGAQMSTYVSHWFPAWYLRHGNVHNSVQIAARTLLSEQHSRLAQEIAVKYAGAPPPRQLGFWDLGAAAACHHRGMDGIFLGLRADLALIEQPYNSYLEAQSAAFRDAVYAWYREVLCCRLLPGARIVLAMSRHHEDDLSGHLLREEHGQWSVLTIPESALAHYGLSAT